MPDAATGASVWATIGAALIAALSPLAVVRLSKRYKDEQKAKEEDHQEKVLEIDLDVRSRADLIDGFNRLLAAQQARITQLDALLASTHTDRELLWKRIRDLSDAVAACESKCNEQARVHAKEISELARDHGLELAKMHDDLRICQAQLSELRGLKT